MISSPWAAALYGACAGLAAGWLSRLSLRLALGASDRVFYAVFAGGIFARLGLLGAAVCLLRNEKYIIIIAFAAAMIAVQTAFEAFPLDHGPRKDTGTPHR